MALGLRGVPVFMQELRFGAIV
ncbi:Hypothetical protein Cp106_0576 [Corynebacterium pseudotuberculosis 1/06-A]|nr:Hypothetical protein Cp106_0576 [Corynebacterium pseudotuberculosis 1/06-A]